MSRGLWILKRQLVRRRPAVGRVGADHPQAQPSSVRNRGYAIRAGVSECVSRSTEELILAVDFAVGMRCGLVSCTAA